MFIIGGIQKTTLLDFPGKVAAIVFTQGCNFTCGYCHNPELLEFDKNTEYNSKDFIDFLKTRIGKLDGVVITGGEPTLQNGLHDFIKEIKSLGFAVKLDTNGTNPNILKRLIKDNLIDYVAMDIKAPFEKYRLISGVNVNIDDIKDSIGLIMQNCVDYEFRTTVLKSQLTIDDFEKIGKSINGAKRYYLQKFIPTKLLDKNLKDEITFTNEELEKICNILSKYIKFTSYR